MGSSNVCILELDFIPPPFAREGVKAFPRRKFLGRPEAIRELLKELNDEENYISEDESQNEDSVEIQNYEFTDSDKDENDELLFESTDEGKSILEKQTQEDENKNLKSEANAEVSNKSD
ncbi:hypothetical protein NPIL_244901 [Nephila pilipes]|uniref:Uncharacterized protein n=1 Tax=Nephila pilipes TaxID=299642 RepID=A0A8X6TN77_NEPPI|nr:hypothetical protein NPIL_244901 [Nephila pilipes]